MEFEYSKCRSACESLRLRLVAVTCGTTALLYSSTVLLNHTVVGIQPAELQNPRQLPCPVHRRPRCRVALSSINAPTVSSRERNRSCSIKTMARLALRSDKSFVPLLEQRSALLALAIL